MSDYITAIEEHVGCQLPPALRELYERGDGEAEIEGDDRPSPSGRPMRLLGSADVIDTFDNYSSCIPLRGAAPFWTGHNGEYAFLFLEGPLEGRIYILDYDGRFESISFRSIESLLESMNQIAGPESWWFEMRTDYFVSTEYFIRGDARCKPAGQAGIASDLAARDALRAEYAAANDLEELDHHHYAMNLMALTPESDTASLFEFLDSDDMWIQARACELLGHRRYEPAIAQLGDVARAGTTNGRGAALDALGRIGTPAALEEILKCLPHFKDGYGWRVTQALARCGCETKEENVDPRGIQSPDHPYKLPGESEWRKV